jgi:predicted ribosome quality control (RQC) complex YloA/Tae2 family protein
VAISAPNPAVAPTSARSASKPAASRSVGEKRTAGPEPRRFVSSEGLPILVGRDNEGNDHLTLHIARSDDLWLHVEGFPGSHVVVRMQGRTGGVPRQTLVEAAKLAAYYSQARSHGKVTVSYTLKKFVRKPRKSPPGLVTVTHEKTVVVKPDKELVARLATMPTDDGP